MKKCERKPNTFKRLRDNESGIAMVEMAMILPAILLLLVAVVDLYAILTVRDQVTSVSQNAGREAMIAISNDELCEDVLERVNTRFERDLPRTPVYSNLTFQPQDFPQRTVGVVNLNIEADLPCILCNSVFKDITYRNSLTYIVESDDHVECDSS